MCMRIYIYIYMKKYICIYIYTYVYIFNRFGSPILWSLWSFGVRAQIHLATSTTLVPRPTWPMFSPDPPNDQVHFAQVWSRSTLLIRSTMPKFSPDPLDYKVLLAQVWPRSTWRPGPLGPSLAQIHLTTRSTFMTKVADQIVFTTRSTLSSDPLHDRCRRMATVSSLVYIYIYIYTYIYIYIYI